MSTCPTQQRRRSGPRAAGTVRHDWRNGLRHLFWCPRGIELGLPLIPNSSELKAMTDRCPDCFPSCLHGKAPKGQSHIYVVWAYPGSRDVYIGVAKDVEHRFYTHFMYGDVHFLPTLEELEDLIRAGKPAPYYEIVDTVPDRERLRREGTIAEAFRDDPNGPFFVFGGR
jgi:hypothetical protein